MRTSGHPRLRAVGRLAKRLAGAVVLGEDHDQAARSGDPPTPPKR